jgi:diguanylate cyclase (GGDEF)-like protein
VTEQVAQDSTSAIFDTLTTVHTSAVLQLALEKEVRRSGRSGQPLALVLLDVDRLSDLNAAHGYGFGDRVLERLDILMRSYFREHDWVGRQEEDSFAVVLPDTAPEHARVLDEQVRAMVEEGLALHDHRSDRIVPVTVSVAVLIAELVDAEATAAEMLAQAQLALTRAKEAGRNRVERIDMKGAPDPDDRERLRRRGPQGVDVDPDTA